MGHAPAVTGFRACAWSAFSTDGDAGLSVKFLGRGLVEQHVRRETGGSRVVGAIRFVRTIYMVVSRPGAEPSMLVLALRLRLVRRVAEWDAACVDMQCACPVSEQIVGEIPVQRLAGQTDGFVRGLQLAVPAFERFRRIGSRRSTSSRRPGRLMSVASEPCGMPDAYTQSIWSRISKPASSMAHASR